MDYTNLLAALDLLDDLVREYNIAVPGERVSIPLWNQVIKFQELHPVDSPAIRDAYMERRYKMTVFLKDKGIIKEFEIEEAGHRWDYRLIIEADPQTVREAFDLCSTEEFERQKEAQREREKQKKVETKVAPVTSNPVTPAMAQKRRHRIKFYEWITLIVAILALVGTWLGVPGFQEWANRWFHIPTLQRSEEPADSLRRRTVKLADDLASFNAERFAGRPTDQRESRQYDQESINLYIAKYRDRTVGILQELQAKGLDTGLLNAPGAAPSRYLMPDEIRQLRDLAYHLDGQDQVVRF